VPEMPGFVSSLMIQMARDINKDLTPNSVDLHFATVVSLLVDNTYTQKRLYLLQYLTSLNLKCFFFWLLLFKVMSYKAA
jgi:hypothetical protein